MREELLKGLSEEQIQKLKGCKGPEEMLRAAKQEGIELTDEQLEAVNGGNCITDVNCPKCGQKVAFESSTDDYWFTCPRCGHRWRDDSMGHLS